MSDSKQISTEWIEGALASMPEDLIPSDAVAAAALLASVICISNSEFGNTLADQHPSKSESAVNFLANRLMLEMEKVLKELEA